MGGMYVDKLTFAHSLVISLLSSHSSHSSTHSSLRFSAPSTPNSSFYELSALDINKQPVDFSSLKGKVVLVSNVASK